MPQCNRCGFPLPEKAEFCPNCGLPISQKPEPQKAPTPNAMKILQAGVFGAFLSMTIQFFLPFDFDFYFIPTFVSALIVTYIFRMKRLDEAIGTSVTVYLFAHGMLLTVFIATLYSQNIPLNQAYSSRVPSLIDVVLYAAEPVTAVIAGYIGSRITSTPERKEPSPFTFRRREKPGGVIYGLKPEPGSPFDSKPHKV